MREVQAHTHTYTHTHTHTYNTRRVAGAAPHRCCARAPEIAARSASNIKVCHRERGCGWARGEPSGHRTVRRRVAPRPAAGNAKQPVQFVRPHRLGDFVGDLARGGQGTAGEARQARHQPRARGGGCGRRCVAGWRALAVAAGWHGVIARCGTYRAGFFLP